MELGSPIYLFPIEFILVSYFELPSFLLVYFLSVEHLIRYPTPCLSVKLSISEENRRTENDAVAAAAAAAACCLISHYQNKNVES